MARRVVRMVSALVAMVLLSGCANLDAVREFTASSSRITAYQDITHRYLTSFDRRLDEIPDDPAFASEKASIEQTRREAADQKASLLKLHELATGYMSALATMAGAEGYSLSGPIDQVAGAIKEIPGLGIAARHVDAVNGLVGRIVSWTAAMAQARDVKTMVAQHGPAMDSVLEAMENVMDNYQGVMTQEHASIRSYNEAKLLYWARPTAVEEGSPATAKRHLLVNTLARRSFAVIEAEQRQASASMVAARAGVTAVREGHRIMQSRVDDLSNAQTKRLLQKAIADLKSAREQLRAL